MTEVMSYFSHCTSSTKWRSDSLLVNFDHLIKLVFDRLLHHGTPFPSVVNKFGGGGGRRRTPKYDPYQTVYSLIHLFILVCKHGFFFYSTGYDL